MIIGVQLLTQVDFDAMSESRQVFIRDRIKAGQVKIVSPEELAPLPKPSRASVTNMKTDVSKSQCSPTKPSIHPSPLRRLLGKSVKITMNNGHVRIGILIELWQFEIVLKPAFDTEIIVLKHAIASIEEDKIGCPTQLHKLQENQEIVGF